MLPPVAWNSMQRIAASRSVSAPKLLSISPTPPTLASGPTFAASTTKATKTAHIFFQAFTSTPPVHTKTIKPYRLPPTIIPPYPYGERLVYKQSNRGLYGNARIRFGDTVTEKHKNTSRRFWRPNVHVKIFHCPSLGACVKTRLTLRVLKIIRREGGIENYLLKSKPARLKELGPGGWNLRWLLMQSETIQTRLNEERIALGLQPKVLENRDPIIQYALDHATPGPLSAGGRAILEKIRFALAHGFDLGPEVPASLDSGKGLSGQVEKQLDLRKHNATG